MKLIIDPALITLNGRFFIFDENGNDIYTSDAKAKGFRRRLTLSDLDGTRLATVRQKLLSLHHTYYICVKGSDEAKLIQKVAALTPHFYVQPLGWNIKGNVAAHKYVINGQNGEIAKIYKEQNGRRYVIDIANDNDCLNVIATVLALECALHDNLTAGSLAAMEAAGAF